MGISSIWWRKKLYRFIVWMTTLGHPFLRDNNIFVVRNDYVPDGRPTIYVGNHVFYGDIHAILANLGANAWLLVSTPGAKLSLVDAFGLWISGRVFIDRFDKGSKARAMQRMKNILKYNGNLLIFPESTIYKTNPAQLMSKLHWGVLDIAAATNANIVPAVVHRAGNGYGVIIGGKFEYGQYSTKQEQIDALRDTLATLVWELLEANEREKYTNIGSITEQYIRIMRDSAEIVGDDIEEEESCIFRPKGEISLGEILAEMHGIEYKSMAADYEQHMRIEKLIKGWTK